MYQTVNQQFNSTDLLISKMSRATFDSAFAGLDRVDVAVVRDAAMDTLTGLLIDDVQYKTYAK